MTRYTKDRRQEAVKLKRPLFTVDLDERHFGGSHFNCTGVLDADNDTYFIKKLKHMLAIAEGKEQP